MKSIFDQATKVAEETQVVSEFGVTKQIAFGRGAVWAQSIYEEELNSWRDGSIIAKLAEAEATIERMEFDVKHWEEVGAPAWVEQREELISEQRERAEKAEAAVGRVQAFAEGMLSGGADTYSASIGRIILSALSTEVEK